MWWLGVYARVARIYDSAGVPLKAVAVLTAIRALVRDHALQARELDDEARERLLDLFRRLGLDAQAGAIKREGPRHRV